VEQTTVTIEKKEKKPWFEQRPIPVFIISSLCVLQFLGISLYMYDHSQELFELVRAGVESPLMFVTKLIYPFFLLCAGLTLFFLRKAAIVFFGVYLAWGIGKIVAHNLDYPGYLSLAMVIAVLVYCLSLRKQGMLR
jgi:hypothetical protein